MPFGAELLFDELKRYVGFSVDDERWLHHLGPLTAPYIEPIVTVFYDRILQHREAKKALVGGERQVGHLKVTLVAWLNELFAGPWDNAYYERRARIGRVHVRIALPQHYMFGAMNVLRIELMRVIDTVVVAEHRGDAQAAVSRMLDLELAIMLHTYREDLLAQQARTERLATFGQLVGSIGHELRNPLGVIETSVFVLKGRLEGDARVTKHLDRIGEQVTLSNDIIRRLLEMIRDQPVQRQQVDLAATVTSALSTFTVPATVEVKLEGLTGLPLVGGDPVQLRQVTLNLLENALHAVGDEGIVQVSANRGPGGITLFFDDSGPGIAPAIRARLFEPLVTTKSHGIGLGLALVRRIMERHHGSVVADVSPLGGARFEVTLPENA